MNEIDLFGNSVAQGIVMDANGQYRVSRLGCFRLLKQQGYPMLYFQKSLKKHKKSRNSSKQFI